MADTMVLVEACLVVLRVQCQVFLFRSLMQKNSKCPQKSTKIAEKI